MTSQSTPSIQIEVAFRRNSLLGEGALWDEKTQSLFWIDILGQKLLRYIPKNRSNVAFDVGEDIGCVVLSANGKPLLGMRSGIATLSMETGELTPITNPEPDTTNNRLNDGKCDPQGRFWVGSMVEDGRAGSGGLYCLDAELSLSQKLTGIDCSNGLVWTRPADTLYYVDSNTQRVDAFDYDNTTGAINNRRCIFEFSKKEGTPDGMAIDSDNYLWVALWGGGKVVRLNPATGKVVFEVSVPAKNVTSCAFGGPEFDELYITTARIDMTPKELEALPLAGSLFKVRVPYQGRATPRFAQSFD